MNKECKRCKDRGKTWEGDDPKCAFTNKIFNIDNWNCATVNELRNLVEENIFYDSDQNCGIKTINDSGFLIVSWYKSRGRVEGIWMLEDIEMMPITLKQAENILENYKNE